jgi:hypothetical protein
MSVFGKIARLPKKLDGIIATNLQPEYGVSPRKIRRKIGICQRHSRDGLYALFPVSLRTLFLTSITQRVLFNEQYKLWTRINGADSSIVLDDKYKAYLHFKEFYRRDGFLSIAMEEEKSSYLFVILIRVLL